MRPKWLFLIPLVLMGVVAFIALGGLGMHHGTRSRLSDRMRERWSARDPEERERIRMRMRAKFGFGPRPGEGSEG